MQKGRVPHGGTQDDGKEDHKLFKLSPIALMILKSKFHVIEVWYHFTKTRPCNIQRFFTAVKMSKNENFLLKSFDFFHIFAQNIDCGYTLEPPH